MLLASPASAQTDAAGLERVLTQMDGAAKNFRSTEANVVWDQYQKVIDETETEKGKIYFRREGGEVQMAADFVEPDKKYVIYSGGKVQIYQPKIDQVTEYNAGKNRADIESFLSAWVRRQRPRPAQILRREIPRPGYRQWSRLRKAGARPEIRSR